jgi:hypothetical protein
MPVDPGLEEPTPAQLLYDPLRRGGYVTNKRHFAQALDLDVGNASAPARIDPGVLVRTGPAPLSRSTRVCPVPAIPT